MEIKIELPHNVRVTCPTPESAITILSSMRFNVHYVKPESEEITYPNSDNARKSYGPPISSSSRPHEGEGFNAHAGSYHDDWREREDVIDDDAWRAAGGDGAQRHADDAGSGEVYDAGPDEKDDDEEDEDKEEEDQDSGSTLHEDLNAVNNRRIRQLGTRGRVHGSEGDNPIFQDALDRMNERTRRVFDFIQTRLVFTTKDVQEHMNEEHGTKLSKKNKKKILKSLGSLEREGIIEEGSDQGEWRKAV